MIGEVPDDCFEIFGKFADPNFWFIADFDENRVSDPVISLTPDEGVQDLLGHFMELRLPGLKSKLHTFSYLPSQLLHQLRKRACWLWRNCF